MLNQNDRLERFAEVINRNADKVCNKLERQTGSFKKKELQLLKTEVKDEFDSKMKFEKDRLISETNKYISSIEAQCRKQTAEKREEIADKVFRKAADRLLQFTNTAEYDAFLKNSMDMLAGGVGENTVIYVKKEDVSSAKALASDNKNITDIRVGDNIKIGGAYASSEDKRVFIYDTLDVRLDNCREWFISESGLTIQ